MVIHAQTPVRSRCYDVLRVYHSSSHLQDMPRKAHRSMIPFLFAADDKDCDLRCNGPDRLTVKLLNETILA